MTPTKRYSLSRIKTLNYASYTQLVRMVKILRCNRPETLSGLISQLIYIITVLQNMSPTTHNSFLILRYLHQGRSPGKTSWWGWLIWFETIRKSKCNIQTLEKSSRKLGRRRILCEHYYFNIEIKLPWNAKSNKKNNKKTESQSIPIKILNQNKQALSTSITGEIFSYSCFVL